MKYILHAILLLTVTAPIISAPAPLPRTSIGVGFRFRSWHYVMEIYRVEKWEGREWIYFEDWEYGHRRWVGGNVMTREELEQLLRECPQDNLPTQRLGSK